MRKLNLAILWAHKSIFGRFAPKILPKGRVTLIKHLPGANLEPFWAPDGIFWNFRSKNGPKMVPRGVPECPKIDQTHRKCGKTTAQENNPTRQPKKGWLVVWVAWLVGWVGWLIRSFDLGWVGLLWFWICRRAKKWPGGMRGAFELELIRNNYNYS